MTRRTRPEVRAAKARTVLVQLDKCLTSGQAAKLMGVSPRMICKMMDTGVLRGRQLPSSEDRRFYLDDVLDCMNRHGMRVPPELDQSAEMVFHAIGGDIPGAVCYPLRLEFGIYLASSHRCRAVFIGTTYGMQAMLDSIDRIKERQPQAIICAVYDESESEAYEFPIDRADMRVILPCDRRELAERVRNHIRPFKVSRQGTELKEASTK